MPITPSPAVLRACDVLGHLTRHPGESFTVSELARVVEVPRATCDAILQALASAQYVTRNHGDRRYRLGPGGIALGDAARTAHPVLQAAKIEAEELARQSESCVAVCIRDGDTARVVEVFDFGPLFALRARVGQTIPLVPPFGAVFVAWADADVDAWLANARPALTTDEQRRYRRALEEVRRRGYSVSVATRRQTELTRAVDTLATSPESEVALLARDRVVQEMMHSRYLVAELDTDQAVRVAQVSAPVFDGSGHAAASILAPGPDYDLAGAELRELVRRIAAAAVRATGRAGGRDSAHGSAAGEDPRAL
ncbi:MAG: helix-turn-helix domain-containing protein [Candidatus Binatia bacterium]|nr:helix-turn-helix domain-containing protein [Candidatus Binatia bacterium]